jgi:uncharacterized membrane protein
MKESRKRSICKAISYRIICIIMLAFIAYLITKDFFQMTNIVIIFQSIQMILYYMHERIWGIIRWGYSK